MFRQLFSLCHHWSERLLPKAAAAIAIVLAIAGCSSENLPNPPANSPANPGDPATEAAPSPSAREELPQETSDRVLQAAATDLKLAASQLEINRYSRETWPDGCLGLAKPEELCTQALVEGWQIEISDGEQNWLYRSDLTGNIVRRADLESSLIRKFQGGIPLDTHPLDRARASYRLNG